MITNPVQHVIPENPSIFIVGGGPCGLMLAIELGRRGVSVVLIDQKPSTALNPQANATQARTMEHFRRLGFADEIRAMGMPADFPTDIAYYTRLARHELARFKLPSAKTAKQTISDSSASWSTAEPPHRVSQKFVEQVLLRHAEALPNVSVNYGWRLVSFEDHQTHVTAEIECVDDGRLMQVRSDYLVGADGARSPVRDALGIKYVGESGVVRDFLGGRMYAVYLRAPDFYDAMPHPRAWMNVTFNHDRRAFVVAVDGKGEFAFHTQLKDHEDEADIDDAGAQKMFEAAVGMPVNTEILSRGTWTAGLALVAEQFRKGRVFIGGDAAHLFTPTGGLGYNTAVDDAVNLGWKLAAVVKGHGGTGLLDSYEAERRPLAVRNTHYARGFADSLGGFVPVAEIEVDGPEGDAARAEAGAVLEAHARAEFNIPGITFGGRYDGSPIIAADGTSPPPDTMNTYVPTACPGGRAPHLWLDEGSSIYDAFGFDWTLLCLGPDAPDGAEMIAAAKTAGLDLTVVSVPFAEARTLYKADFALVRPDQIVAWRGDDVTNAAAILQTVTGNA